MIFWWNLEEDISKRKNLEGGAICIGNFDGLHPGHIEVIRSALSSSRRVFIMTFLPHPHLVLKPEGFFFLTSLYKKYLILKNLGVSDLIVVPFLLVKDMDAFNFLLLIKKLNPLAIYVGENFTFGKGAEGDINTLISIGNRLGIKVFCSTLIKINNEKNISSSLLRKLIRSGSVEKYFEVCGRYYSVMGSVVRGVGRGKTLGFPTANLNTTYELPYKGVYICTVKLENEIFGGVCNVGGRPTFEENINLLEVYVLNFNGLPLYGKRIEVTFIKRLRDIIKFPSMDELSETIRSDVQAARNYFKEFSLSSFSKFHMPL